MAYNQEYPNYLDAQLYNNDWLLYKVKKNEGDISDLKTKTAENEAKISALDTRVETNATAIAELKTETTVNTSSIASLVTVTTSNTDRIEALEQGGGGGGGDPALEGRVKTLEDDMADVQADVTAINTAVTQMQTTQETQETAISSLQTSFSAMSTTLSSFSTTLSAHTDQIAGIENEQTEQNERITALENKPGGETRDILFTASSIERGDVTVTTDDITQYSKFVFYFRMGNGMQEIREIAVIPTSSWQATFIAGLPANYNDTSVLRMLFKRVLHSSTNNNIIVGVTYEQPYNGGSPAEQSTYMTLWKVEGIKK